MCCMFSLRISMYSTFVSCLPYQLAASISGTCDWTLLTRSLPDGYANPLHTSKEEVVKRSNGSTICVRPIRPNIYV